MRQSLTAVLERGATLTGSFATEPYEAAWAAEARWFVRTLAPPPDGARLLVHAQVSPDGLHWCDLDEPRPVDAALVSWTSVRFGGWLRLAGTLEPGGTRSAETTVHIYLALKS